MGRKKTFARSVSRVGCDPDSGGVSDENWMFSSRIFFVRKKSRNRSPFFRVLKRSGMDEFKHEKRLVVVKKNGSANDNHNAETLYWFFATSPESILKSSLSRQGQTVEYNRGYLRRPLNLYSNPVCPEWDTRSHTTEVICDVPSINSESPYPR